MYFKINNKKFYFINIIYIYSDLLEGIKDFFVKLNPNKIYCELKLLIFLDLLINNYFIKKFY